jgi:hypothetical protein
MTGYSGHSLLDDDAETAASIALSQYYHAAGLADDEIDHSLNPRDFTAYAGWLWFVCVRVLGYSEILHARVGMRSYSGAKQLLRVGFAQVAVFCPARAPGDIFCASIPSQFESYASDVWLVNYR